MTLDELKKGMAIYEKFGVMEKDIEELERKLRLAQQSRSEYFDVKVAGAVEGITVKIDKELGIEVIHTQLARARMALDAAAKELEEI